MFRLMITFIMLLGVAACLMRGVADGPVSLDRTIHASRDRLFDVLENERNMTPMRKVSDTGDRILYEMPLDVEIAREFGHSLDAQFEGGMMSAVVEPDSRLSVRVRDRASRVRIEVQMNFADGDTAGTTRVTSDAHIEDPKLNDASRAAFEKVMDARMRPQLSRMLDEIETAARTTES